ncbi:Gfo/Idh/MocA family oxidoreductase [Steroidobacter sp. S1-65]|uniref:Gfo/Idh/MocA family oxidoreductase n=1 Tax=Steroidobacter gossypii TaxID=2805490 RepID=A0ABS1WRJ8_9GAMM|nr:Gfo/Idh/MocA family oxidoreductase [Steroidobacter gossypii]MBM0103595.1 Gfo/Idh/MocA family oxidoreductase [Steroidobacter gossypii]
MQDLSRRRFMKGAAAATLAAPFISTGARAAAPDKKLGVALCGLGSLSTKQIAPALQKTQHCRLAGIVTGSSEKAEEWRKRYDLPKRSVYSYDTMHRMADNDDIDIVYVVTPNALHLEHTVAAAQAGKHVFCEKPLEISVERCQQMIDACKAAERMLGTAYRCRFEPHHQECIRLAREQELGPVRIIEAGFGIDVGRPDQWRLKHALSGGGALMDVGVYALQATRYLTGEEPVLVTATETKTDAVKFKEVDETISWTAQFPSGANAYCTASFKIGGIKNFRANCERGWFELDPAYYYGGIKGSRSDGKPLSFPEVDMFAAQLDDFARCIKERRPTIVPGEEGLQDVRIMSAIYESARTGRAIRI